MRAAVVAIFVLAACSTADPGSEPADADRVTAVEASVSDLEARVEALEQRESTPSAEAVPPPPDADGSAAHLDDLDQRVRRVERKLAE